MMLFDEIKKFFPKSVNLEKNARDMIKESLQYKVLEIIYKEKDSGSLIFTGGTSLRFFHDFKRNKHTFLKSVLVNIILKNIVARSYNFHF